MNNSSAATETGIEFKTGSTRSAAMVLSRYLQTNNRLPEARAQEIAWTSAKLAKNEDENFGPDILLKIAGQQLKTSVTSKKQPAKAAAKKTVAKSADTTGTVAVANRSKAVLPEELMPIALDESKSKNQRIKELLAIDGVGPTAIAKAMGLGYQRVKNVKKQPLQQ
jgi:hypothetical protein